MIVNPSAEGVVLLDTREGVLCGIVTRGPVTSVSSSEAPDLRVPLAGSWTGMAILGPAITGGGSDRHDYDHENSF